jgi:group II intron reverse transcriptase/maturase
MSKLPVTILNMVTIRNLIRLAGTSLSYWSPHINDQVATWLKLCVENYSQENTGTALQKEDNKTQEPKFNRLKNRKNLRTTGFNLCNNCYKGKRSVHSTLCIKEGTQANKLFANYRRLFTTKIRPNNLNERVLATKLKQMVEKCKGKDGRYGNLIQIVGSLPTIKLAYLMIKSNLRISAKRVNYSTLDGISLNILQTISQDTLSGKFKFSPARRVFIPKPGKTNLRPLSVSSPREEIVQKAIEIVLTSIFEEFFLDCNHRFRPGHSCHTALKHLQFKIGNASTYSWVIKGDIKGCFDNIPHYMILKRLKRKIDCPVTLNLIKQILSAGYILNGEFKKIGRKNAKVYKSNIGIPQSIILNPLLNIIVLHELDEFINNELKKEFTKNKQRKPNLEYRKLRYRIKRENDLKKKRVLINNCRKVSSKDFHDPDFKKLFYVRYADDWVLLVAGSLKDTEVICNKVSNKLQSLGLTLNIEKTRITSLKKSKCRFLGIDFFIHQNTEKHRKPISLMKKSTIIRQRFVPQIILHAPILELLTKLKDKGFVKRSSKNKFFPIGKSNCIPLTHPQILNYFNIRIRAVLNYYSCVHNRNELWSIVRFLNYSCALTLARKFKLKSLARTFKKFGRDLEFVNKIGKKYKIFKPDNLRMLPMNERFKVSENTNIVKLVNQTWSNNLIFNLISHVLSV